MPLSFTDRMAQAKDDAFGRTASRAGTEARWRKYQRGDAARAAKRVERDEIKRLVKSGMGPLEARLSLFPPVMPDWLQGRAMVEKNGLAWLVVGKWDEKHHPGYWRANGSLWIGADGVTLGRLTAWGTFHDPIHDREGFESYRKGVEWAERRKEREARRASKASGAGRKRAIPAKDIEAYAELLGGFVPDDEIEAAASYEVTLDDMEEAAELFQEVA